VHLDAVAEIVRTVDPSPLAATVAYLHDVVEDTEIETIEICRIFGGRVASAVWLLTDPPGYPNRKTRKAELHRTLAKLEYPNGGPAERLALLVKTADRLANVREAVSTASRKAKMYRKEHRVFRASCYRDGLADPLWAELDALIVGAA